MLAEAVCKLNGFTYAPSDTHFWQHGYSTERDFIYVTTQTLTAEQLARMSHEVGEDRSLLVCCGAFRGAADQYPNLTIKKIPRAVLSRCEWGKDDYSLKVSNLPVESVAARQSSEDKGSQREPRGKKERRAARESADSLLSFLERGQ